MGRYAVAVCSALLLAVALPGQPGLASQPIDVGPSSWGQTLASPNVEDGVTQDAAEALAADLGAIREAHGWSAEQIAAYEASEAALDAVSELVSTKYPTAFVGSAIAHDPTEPPRAYVKGNAPADVRALASELGVEMVEEQPYSLDELDARLAIVHDAVLTAGFENVVVAADIEREGAITVVVTASSREDLDLILTGIAPGIAKDITIIVGADPIVAEQGAFGGMFLDEDGFFQCTSGWTVRKIAGGERGITGAGHCFAVGVNQIRHPDIIFHTAFFQNRHEGQWGDIGWWTTGQLEADDFYADQFNNIRDVTAVEPRANISIGESICVYGRKSNNRNCQLTVENPNLTCGALQRLVLMNGAVTLGGDSGGGWSTGTKAYGSHMGLCYSKSTFSVADLYDEALGVTVALN